MTRCLVRCRYRIRLCLGSCDHHSWLFYDGFLDSRLLRRCRDDRRSGCFWRGRDHLLLGTWVDLGGLRVHICWLRIAFGCCHVTRWLGVFCLRITFVIAAQQAIGASAVRRTFLLLCFLAYRVAEAPSIDCKAWTTVEGAKTIKQIVANCTCRSLKTSRNCLILNQRFHLFAWCYNYRKMININDFWIWL